MTLIASVSGIRGTIGGAPGTALTPPDIVAFVSAYGQKMEAALQNKPIVVGRDARMSGPWVRDLVTATLRALGIQVIDIGLASTPTVEMAVKMAGAAGGIIITASHNPREWNALKLLNADGEFISAQVGQEIVDAARKGQTEYAAVEKGGALILDNSYTQKHLDAILALPQVNRQAIAAAKFKIVVDAVNSVGAVVVPMLLKALGVDQIWVINEATNGKFAHNPEPLPEHLSGLSSEVLLRGAHLGIAVDPDVDRLALMDENGNPFGEEYTLVAVADYMLGLQKGNSVSNMSSSRALKVITEKHGGSYFSSPVGEVHVVEAMKKNKAIIGGEGNGGIIVPQLHYGRDALAGIALFLSHLALSRSSVSGLKGKYPALFMYKSKLELEEGMDLDALLSGISDKYDQFPIDTRDGVRIDFGEEWVHLRKSNTEPIIRIYSESTSETSSQNLVQKLITDFKDLI